MRMPRVGFWRGSLVNMTDIPEKLTAPLKHQSVSTRLHGAASQKTTIFDYDNDDQ
jgi:hypothetical protein